MTPKCAWTLNSQKYSIYTKYIPPEAQLLVRFALQLAISEMHVQTRSPKIGKASNNPKLNLNT